MQKLLMQLSGLGEEKKKIERTICPYCHQFHSKDQLVENLCPKMIGFAKIILDKQSYQCKDCFGEGSFEKKIQTKIYQTNKKYQQRLQVWQSNGQIDQKPQRKLLKEQKIEQTIQCKKCVGKGKIYKLCYKKSNNLRQYTNQVNEYWVEQKMKGQKGNKELYCSICMEHNEATTISLNCTHSFHLKCLYIWLKTSKTCPMCRKIDPFLDLNMVSAQIKEPPELVVQRGNRQINSRQIGQQIQRRNYYNMIVDEPHPRMFNFGFGSHYSEDEEDW